MKCDFFFSSVQGQKISVRRRRNRLSMCAALLCVLLCGCAQLKNAAPISDVHAMDGQRVGVAIAWGPDYILSDREDITLMRYNSVAGMVTALCYQRLDAVAVEEPMAQEILRKVDGLRCIEEPVAEDRLTVIVNPDRTALLEEINRFIPEFIGSPEYEDLVERSRHPDGYTYKPVLLTGGNEVLQIGAVSDSYPFSYPNLQTGEFEGTDVEFLSHFANAHGYGLEFHGDSWASMELGVQHGRYDIGVGGMSDMYRGDIEKGGLALVSDTFFPINIVLVEIADREALAVKSVIAY